MIRRSFLTTVFASLIASPAFAEIHTYRLPRIASTEQNCQASEQWIVPKFAQLAEATVLNHGCEVNPSRTFDLVIEYAKPTLANLVSTYDEFDYVHGLYNSAEDCTAHYDEDLATFKQATGLEPLLAYCFLDRGGEDFESVWTMRIDGFGTPKLTPDHLAKDFYHGMNGDPAAFEGTLKTTLAAYGAQHVKVKIKTSENRTTMHAFYYSDKRLPLVQYGEGQFRTLQACENNRSVMQEVFSRADGQSVIFFCGGSNYTSTVYLYAAGIVMQPLATDLTSVKYSTFEACEAKRRETESNWRDGLQKNVVGSVCAIEDNLIHDYVRMRMFWLD
jgi:hypothetical protein